MIDCKLYWGDCLEVMKDISDGSIDVVITDPPYGTTACKWDSIIPLEPMWEQLKRIIKPNGAIVMTSSQPFTTKLISSNYEMFKYILVWNKVASVGFLNARRQPLRLHEDIVIFYKQQPTYNPQGLKSTYIKSSRRHGKTKHDGTYGTVKNKEYYAESGNFPRSIIAFNRITHKQVHPTQKPVALMGYLIRTYTNEGEVVLDFAFGSGTTGVACAKTGRNFIGIEIDPNYFSVAEKRIKVAVAQPLLFSE